MLFSISLIIGWLFVKFQIFKPPRGQLNCGIFGFSGSRPVDVTKLKWLAAENQVRGTDSCGVYGNQLFKEKGRAKDVIQMPGFNAAIKGAHTVQGHTRAATFGSVSKENAHPFHFGYKSDDDPTKWSAEVVGSHNGFLVTELLKHYDEYFEFKKYYPVDSQYIFAALAKTGDVNVISKLEGGMAISFQILSHNPNRLYLYKRQYTRPLHIGDASDGIYYSSESDPLKYIGCRTIWELTPNMLYTLEGGEIIDVYEMPDPVLKSLAANVRRGEWRQGATAAQLNALPISAGSQGRLLASGKKGQTDNGQQSAFSFSHGNKAGFSNNNYLNNRVSTEYSPKNSLDSKFKTLINELTKEITLLEVDPLKVAESISREQNYMSGCVLAVRIKNQDDNKGLVAWAVLADGDSDLSGVTAANGVAMIHIPLPKCQQDIKFYVYAAVDQFGPFTFDLTPEAGRVMEVALSIPFLKKGRKKGQATHTVDIPFGPETGSGIGSMEYPSYPFGAEPLGIHEADSGEDSDTLRQETEQVSRGSKRQKTNGPLSECAALASLVPETELSIGIGPTLDEKVKNTVIHLPDESRRAVMSMALQFEDGSYVYLKQMTGAIIQWAVKHPERAKWLDYYQRNHMSMLRVSELILDASRLMQRDRFITNTWFPFWAYIEVLLRDKFATYLKLSAVSTMTEVLPEPFYPSTAIKLGLTSESKKKRKQSFLSCELSERP